MLTARAFWIVRRRVGLDAGSEPLAFTAMVISLAMRANCFAMRFQRANIVALRTSKMRPMARMVHEGCGACQDGGRWVCRKGRTRSFRRQKSRLLPACRHSRWVGLPKRPQAVSANRLKRVAPAGRARGAAEG